MLCSRRENFHIELPDEILKLSAIFNEAGHQLYVVGGAVRDALMGLPPKDFDLATDATPTRIREFLKPHNYSILELGEAFGVSVLVLPYPLERVEIATFREDMSEGRHPIIRFASIEDDVKRRDLTINSLFYDIGSEMVVDLVGGIDDIRNGVIRAFGVPEERFREDRLRILRVFRFASRMSFSIADDMQQAIMRDNNLHGVSGERIRDEFVRGIATAKSVRQFLSSLDKFGMFSRIFPGLNVSRTPDVMVSSSGPESRFVPVILAILLAGNETAKVAKVLNKLNYTTDEIRSTTFLMNFADLHVDNAFKLRRQFDSFANGNDEDMLLEFVDVRGLPDPSMSRAFFEYRPSVSGDDLLAQGFSGADIGREMLKRETELFVRLLGAR